MSIAAQAPVGERQPSLRVLVVEDSPTQAVLVLSLLSHAPMGNLDAMLATTLEEAERLIQTESLDVVLLDLWLPDASELESLLRLKELAPMLPVVVQTGMGDDELGIRAVKSGAQDYVAKSELSPGLLGRILNYAVERANAQQQLQEREARLLAITNNLPGAVFEKLIGADGHSRYLSMFGHVDEYYGVSAERLLAEPGALDAMLDPEDAQRLASVSREAAARFAPYELEIAHRMPSGERRWKLEKAWPKRRFDEQVVFDGVSLDITARKAAEQACREAEAKLRQFEKMDAFGQVAGKLAHDFNNRLTVILGNLDLLGLRDLPEEQRTSLLAAAHRGAEGAATLAQRLLAFSRSKPIDPTRIDVSERLVALRGRFAGRAGDEILLRLEPGLEPAPVLLDAEQFDEVLVALVDNACDAMPDGGSLTVETATVPPGCVLATGEAPADKEHVMIAVRDSGAGMPADVVSCAFDPFFSTKPSSQANGLGLSLVFGFARQCGGGVHLESDVGKGTTVRLWLPRCEDAPAARRLVCEPDTAPVDRARPARILVVEDNEDVRRLAVEALGGDQVEIIEANGGAEAIQAFENSQPIELLFTDIEMPGGMSGFDIARELRRRQQGLQILFTSGYAEHGPDANETEDYQAKWIAKPYSLRELRRKVDDLLQKAPAPAARDCAPQR